MGRGLLLLMSGMVIILGIIQISLNERQEMIPERTNQYFKKEQAKNISSSLMDLAIEQIRSDNLWVGSFSKSNFLGGTGYVQAYDENSTSYPDSNNAGVWDEYKVLLYSQATYEGYTAETEVLVQRNAFSRYSYFTNFEPSNIYFFTGDVLSGPVHTNGTFKIAGQPVFQGMVTSPNNWQGAWWRNDNSPDLQGGANFSANNVPPPDVSQLNKLKSASLSGGLSYNNPISVEFLSDGRVTIRENTTGNWSQATESTYNLSTINGVISSSMEVRTKGTLKGQVTLHSETKIEIIGDLKYSADPAIDSTSTDLLGLVSEGEVLVDQNAHTDSGTKNITIQAAIMALNQSFSVENYNTGSPRGEINLLGGITQISRGAVGTFSGNSVASGFSKDYVYDTRLLRMYPPLFPREKWFSIIYWRDRTNPNQNY